jgi:hypothetical protein
MPRLQQRSCKGSEANGVHGLGGLLESMEACSKRVFDTPCGAPLHWSLSCGQRYLGTSHVYPWSVALHMCEPTCIFVGFL